MQCQNAAPKNAKCKRNVGLDLTGERQQQLHATHAVSPIAATNGSGGENGGGVKNVSRSASDELSRCAAFRVSGAFKVHVIMPGNAARWAGAQSPSDTDTDTDSICICICIPSGKPVRVQVAKSKIQRTLQGT